jgi:hypothetical protein
MGAPGQQGMANSPAQMMQQNAIMRAALLQSAPRMRKNLGNFTVGGSPGQTSRIKLFNVGITTKVVLDITATFDIGVAIATPSPKAPFNLANRIKLTDFDGTDRCNLSGYQLWVMQAARNQCPYGFNNGSLASVSTNPVVPTAIGVGQVMRFQIEVPLAYDVNDLRGALLTQSAVGEAWINIDWNNLMVSNANADAVYNGAGTTTIANTVITVNAFQEYLLPQSIGGQVPLPALDLMTVYELAGSLKSSDNIAVGQEKLFNYPNVRSVIGAYFNYINNGVMNAAPTDISKFRLIANGNNVLREYQPLDKLFDQRRWMKEDADLKVGTYFEMHRDKPIETALYGNVQYGITPLTAGGGNQYFEVAFESFYTKGSTLPGLSQTS